MDLTCRQTNSNLLSASPAPIKLIKLSADPSHSRLSLEDRHETSGIWNRRFYEPGCHKVSHPFRTHSGHCILMSQAGSKVLLRTLINEEVTRESPGTKHSENSRSQEVELNDIHSIKSARTEGAGACSNKKLRQVQRDDRSDCFSGGGGIFAILLL